MQLHVSLLLPVSTPGLTKETNTLLPPGFEIFHAGLTVLQPSPPGFPGGCTVPKLSGIPAFEMLSRHTPGSRIICPNHQRVSETQTSAFAEAIRTTKKHSREYGEQHNFQQYGSDKSPDMRLGSAQRRKEGCGRERWMRGGYGV